MSAYSTAPSPSDVAHLAQQHFPLVVHIAKRFQRSGVPLDDLIGEGSIGLIRGLQAYDPDRGPLGPHLGACIKHSIIAGLRRWKPWRPLPSDTEGEDLAIEDQHGEAPDSGAEYEDEKGMVEQLLVVLRPRQRRVIEMYYFKDYTLAELGRQIGVGKERARQLLAGALKRMGKHARQDVATAGAVSSCAVSSCAFSSASRRSPAS